MSIGGRIYIYALSLFVAISDQCITSKLEVAATMPPRRGAIADAARGKPSNKAKTSSTMEADDPPPAVAANGLQNFFSPASTVTDVESDSPAQQIVGDALGHLAPQRLGDHDADTGARSSWRAHR